MKPSDIENYFSRPLMLPILIGASLLFIVLFFVSVTTPKELPPLPPAPAKVTLFSPTGGVTELGKAFEKVIEEFRAKDRLAPGMGVAIVKNGKIDLLKGYGLCEAGGSDTVDIHTVFRLASLSKGFTALLAAKLVEEGKFDFDDKVTDYLPHVKLSNLEYTNQLTIRHLLSHTTGLPRHTFGNLIEAEVPFEQMVQQLRTVPLTGPPGRLFAYQNVSFSLVGDICETVTGKSYSELLDEYIFRPFEMNNSSSTFSGIVMNPNVAEPHGYTSKKTIKMDPEYFAVAPAAGVNASITDMSKYMMALLGHEPGLISQEALTEMFTPNIPLNQDNRYSITWKKLRKAEYGLGWRVFDYDGTEILHHSGFVNGYRAEIALCPELDLGISVLTNSFNDFSNRCIPKFFDLVMEQKEEQQ